MDILNCFYNDIVTGAQKGFIENDEGYFFVSFNTVINGFETNSYTSEYIPTLFIKNKEEFEKYLVEYVKLVKKMYPYDNKVIMGMLFADATAEDFNDILPYIKRRIDFINNPFMKVHETEVLGYSDILGGEVHITCEKDSIYNETPYYINATIFNNELYMKGEMECFYDFPLVKVGVSEDTAYIYAIQSKRKKDSEFRKKINRKLYKVGEGFDNLEEREDENLKDVSASFVTVCSLLLGILEKNGINKIVIPSLRIVRWNNKKESIEKKVQILNQSERELYLLNKEHERIQSNLSEKFIRTFLRLSHHFDGLEVTAFPFDIDSSLHIKNNCKLECNNQLLKEMYEIGLQKNIRRGL